MGELADDAIMGRSCYHCGVYFERENGFPVLCPDCWSHQGHNLERQSKSDKRAGHARITKDGLQLSLEREL